jgi:3-dehydroquinate synthase
MARRIDLDLGERGYPIHLGAGLLADAGRLIGERLAAGPCLLVSDATVAAHHGAACAAGLRAAGFAPTTATFPAGETSKTVATAVELWQACAAAGIGRDGGIVACGGGVTGDLAGFIAATWMRGVAFAQIPTTLLAMVDSAVGGKTGVNLPAGKNLIGAFHQPICVIADPLVLATLPPREYRAGLAEVLKYGVIGDPAFLTWQEAHAAALAAGEPGAVERAVAESCATKARYVAADEREDGVRAHLNYGHTFGHALEAEGGYAIWLHGEAIGIGMRMAVDLARRLGVLTDPTLAARQDALLAAYRLPMTHPVTDPDTAAVRLAGRCRQDKKARAGRVRFILPRRAGEVMMVTDPPTEAVVAAFRSALGGPR